MLAKCTVTTASCYFFGFGGDPYLDLLCAEIWMNRFQDSPAGMFLSANPDRAGSAHQRKGVVTDELRRALKIKFDGFIRKRAYAAEFIGDTQDHAS